MDQDYYHFYNILHGSNRRFNEFWTKWRPFVLIVTLATLSILVARKYAIILSLIIFGIYILIAAGFITNFLSPITDLNALVRNPMQWISSIFTVFSLSVIFIFAFGDVYHKLIQAFEDRKISETKFQMIFEKANDAILLLKKDKIIDCNQMACDYFQYGKEELIGKSVIEISPEFQYDGQRSEKKALDLLTFTLKNQNQKIEWQHKRANGELFDLSISLNKLELQGETFIQAILRDITDSVKQQRELQFHKENLEKLVQQRTLDLKLANEEWKSTSEDLVKKNKIIHQQNEELNSTLKHLKEAQSKLLQSDKMASLGTLTAGVSHEINNPLNYLSGTYYGFEKYFEKHGSEDPKKTSFLLSSTQTAIERISAIVNGLNQFSRDNQKYDEDCDLHAILDNCLTILHNKIKHKAEVEKNYLLQSIIIKGNVGKLHQVFTNILTNSVQAINEKGLITLSTSVKDGNAVVNISDSGCGISKENLVKIADPFFTTKAPGEGTGLGLSITYTILQDHNGSMEYESELNVGTKVKVTFPLKS